MTRTAPAVIVIPAYEPTAALADVVAALAATGRAVIVVDDGSSAAARNVFDRIAGASGVRLVGHPVNRGKGEALKTAFALVLREYRPETCGVVTADADGQHLAPDIVRVAERLEASPAALVLGSRSFDGRVPLRSRVGNGAMRTLFHALAGRDLSDTQTGLRGIPRAFLADLIALTSSRYDFEFEMLMLAARRRLEIVDVPIATVYGAPGQSHFRPVADSVRVLSVLVRASF
ncbi:MAG TPA: glycosyltransferase family 2 protein [Vicinamibacterales bacterium]|nr:glycosyltransferase family 2 protein [Vicinamibacterales bacterium]